MKNLFFSLTTIYFLLCLLLSGCQRKLLYFPQPPDPGVGATPLSFTNGAVTLQGWIVNEGSNRALLYYGGNAENIERNIDFFQSVLPEYSVYLVPYRGYGNSTGKPSEAGLYSDALYIYDQIQPRHDSMALMGRSLGTGVATYVAAQRKVDKLLLVTPYDSIENVAREVYWMFPVSLLLRDKYHSYRRARDIDASVLVLIAEHDEVISRRRSEALVEAFEARQQIEVAVIENARHNDIEGFSDYVTRVKNFFNPVEEVVP